MESTSMHREFPKKGRPSFRGKPSPHTERAVSLLRVATQLEESSMKKMFLVLLVVVGVAGLAMAQIGAAPATDVLGAHLNYGRGCAACHAPHSGAAGNGQASSAGSGNTMLWGEDVSALYGKTISTGGGKYVEVLPTSMSANTP